MPVTIKEYNFKLSRSIQHQIAHPSTTRCHSTLTGVVDLSVSVRTLQQDTNTSCKSHGEKTQLTAYNTEQHWWQSVVKKHAGPQNTASFKTVSHMKENYIIQYYITSKKVAYFPGSL
jgi:hypothetical protein